MMKISLRKNLDAIRSDTLLRLDTLMRARRDAVCTPNADVHAMKLAEARRLNGPTPLLDREAVTLGRPVTAIAQMVIAKAKATAEAVAAIEAQRQTAQAAIRSATTPAAIEAVLDNMELPNG